MKMSDFNNDNKYSLWFNWAIRFGFGGGNVGQGLRIIIRVKWVLFG